MKRKRGRPDVHGPSRGGSAYVLGSSTVDYRRLHVNFHSDAPFKVLQHLIVDDMLVGHYIVTPGYAVWRRYGSDRWQAICSASGTGRWGLPEKGCILGQRQLILTKPGPAWDYGIAPGALHWDVYGITFDPPPNWRSFLDWPEDPPGVMRVSIDDLSTWRRVLYCFRAAVRWAQSPWLYRRQLIMTALEQALLLTRRYLGDVGGPPLDSRVRLVADWICRDVSRPLDLEDLARRVNLSTSRLTHLFTDELKVSPRVFLESQRIEQARRLLESTDYPVKTIAHQLGYASQLYFSRRFARATGKSPTEYRQMPRRSST